MQIISWRSVEQIDSSLPGSFFFASLTSIYNRPVRSEYSVTSLCNHPGVCFKYGSPGKLICGESSSTILCVIELRDMWISPITDAFQGFQEALCRLLTYSLKPWKILVTLFRGCCEVRWFLGLQWCGVEKSGVPPPSGWNGHSRLLWKAAKSISISDSAYFPPDFALDTITWLR